MLHPTREQLLDVVKALRRRRLRHVHRPHRASTTSATTPTWPARGHRRPSGSRSSSRSSRHEAAERIRLRVQVPERRPDRARRCSTLHPGTEAMEREVFDMFGITFTATPTSPASSCPRTGRATRCARTTRSGASRCSSRGDPVSDDHRRTADRHRRRSRSEGAQEMQARAARRPASRSCARSARCCACPRPRPRSLAEPPALDGRDHDHQHGPAAPVAPTACCGSCSSSTARPCCACKPIIGYLHTGMEKTGEELTYLQGAHQRHAHGLPRAALQRAGVLAWPPSSCSTSSMPERATWIRMLMSELNRMSSATCCSSPPTAWTSAPCR